MPLPGDTESHRTPPPASLDRIGPRMDHAARSFAVRTGPRRTARGPLPRPPSQPRRRARSGPSRAPACLYLRMGPVPSALEACAGVASASHRTDPNRACGRVGLLHRTCFPSPRQGASARDKELGRSLIKARPQDPTGDRAQKLGCGSPAHERPRGGRLLAGEQGDTDDAVLVARLERVCGQELV